MDLPAKEVPLLATLLTKGVPLMLALCKRPYSTALILKLLVDGSCRQRNVQQVHHS